MPLMPNILLNIFYKSYNKKLVNLILDNNRYRDIDYMHCQLLILILSNTIFLAADLIRYTFLSSCVSILYIMSLICSCTTEQIKAKNKWGRCNNKRSLSKCR